MAVFPAHDVDNRRERELFIDTRPQPLGNSSGDAVELVDTTDTVVDRVVYIFFGDGIADSKAALVFGRKSLGLTATGRNWNTVLKIAGLLGV